MASTPIANASFARLPVADDRELLVDDDCRRAVAHVLGGLAPDLVILPHGEDTNGGHRRAWELFRELAATTTKPLLALYHKDRKTIRIRIDA